MVSTRAQILTRRTYNRPKDELGVEFETWGETVGRVIDHQLWLWERALDRELNVSELEELEEFRDLLLERKCFVSGRTLWLGGTEISRTRESSQFNCLSGDTKVFTKEFGLVEIAELEGETCHVLNDEGNFVLGTCHSGGTQELMRVKLSNKRSQREVFATPNHRWWLEDGTRVETRELKSKTKIPFVRPNAIDYSQDGFIHGLMYADGTISKNSSGEYYRIRLCGDKSQYLEMFEGYDYSYPPSALGDAFVYLGNVENFELDLKEIPYGEDPEYVAGFIHGFLAGDGHKDGSGFSGGKDIVEFIVQWSHLIGQVVTSYHELPKETNYGKRKEPCYKAVFKVRDNDYYVQFIEQMPRKEEVYCFEVPDGEAFVLEGGILTSNCSFTEAETVRDAVDALWLLMQGCGVGFMPKTGTLNGFSTRIKEVAVINTEREGKGGREYNEESYFNGIWTISVGDSAESWSKALGKLLAGKYPGCKQLVLDFSQIRPAGERLKGYGWISSGDEALTKAFTAIAEIMNKRAGHLLTAIDILDIYNWMGTILSSRRSAEIALLDYGHPEWKEFALAKKNCWMDNPQRQQSNNSLVFRSKPSYDQLKEIFDIMIEGGGSEPGFINAEEALKRAPWFKGCNPCAEILLGNKSFCNLTEVDVGKFQGDSSGLERAVHIVARANYRQTCVDLDDGVLQEEWHKNNEFLRLCGVGLTGLVKRKDLSEYDLSNLQRIATYAAYSMADALGTQRPKNVTTVKPSGTLSKIADTTEGVHKPLGRYIFNNVNFSKYDPLVEELRRAGYRSMPNPTDDDAVIITLPVEYDNVEFDIVNGKEVNLESAVAQLERYKKLQNHWTQQNTSVTISYDTKEVEQIIYWLLHNWDCYVGVSFIYRNDPTKTAKDLGYAYLPQEVVTKEEYEKYVDSLGEIDLESNNSLEEIMGEDCATGACPVK